MFVKKIIAGSLCLFLLAGCTSTTHQAANTAAAASTAATTAPSASASSSATASATADASKKVTITNSVAVTSKTLDMSGYEWLDDANPAFIQITMSESLRLVDEGGTGIILYSYTSCPWCNRAVPVLNEAAKEMGVHIYYVDVYESELMDASGKAFSAEGKTVIQSMLTHFDSILKHETNSTTGVSEPTLYTPEVVAIKKGAIAGHHTSLVDSFTMTTGDEQMDDAQKAELKGIYEDLIKSVAD
jgi:thiol-disulfide isomerase/thioredoxin